MIALANSGASKFPLVKSASTFQERRDTQDALAFLCGVPMRPCALARVHACDSGSCLASRVTSAFPSSPVSPSRGWQRFENVFWRKAEQWFCHGRAFDLLPHGGGPLYIAWWPWRTHQDPEATSEAGLPHSLTVTMIFHTGTTGSAALCGFSSVALTVIRGRRQEWEPQGTAGWRLLSWKLGWAGASDP